MILASNQICNYRFAVTRCYRYQCNYKRFELLINVITCHKGSIPGLQTSELELDPNSEAMHVSISMMTEWQLLAHPSDYICS